MREGNQKPNWWRWMRWLRKSAQAESGSRLLRASAILLLAGFALPAWAGPTGAAPDVDADLIDKLARTMAANHPGTDRFDAEVWLAASDQRLSRFLRNREQRLSLLRIVYRESHRQTLDPDLVLAVMQVESSFDSYAISRVGAQGLMQVMPFWRLEIGRPQDNLTVVETNIRYGTTILAHYVDVAGGDLVDALARYNGSRGRLDYPERVVGAWRLNWRNKMAGELQELQDSCANYALQACGYN